MKIVAWILFATFVSAIVYYMMAAWHDFSRTSSTGQRRKRKADSDDEVFDVSDFTPRSRRARDEDRSEPKGFWSGLFDGDGSDGGGDGGGGD